MQYFFLLCSSNREMQIVLNKNGTELLISGKNTFVMKDELKALGWRWNAAEKAWTNDFGTDEALESFMLESVGILFLNSFAKQEDKVRDDSSVDQGRKRKQDAEPRASKYPKGGTITQGEFEEVKDRSLLAFYNSLNRKSVSVSSRDTVLRIYIKTILLSDPTTKRWCYTGFQFDLSDQAQANVMLNKIKEKFLQNKLWNEEQADGDLLMKEVNLNKQ